MDCNRGNLRAVVGLLFPSRLPLPAAGPPVELAAAAAACAPSRPRSRHSARSTVVRHRRLAVSGPLGVRVGRSAALRGLPNLRGYLRVPPEIRIVPVNAVPSAIPAPLAPRDSPRLLPNLEQQSDTGAPSTTWHPPAHHGVAYADPSTVDAVSSAKVVYQAPPNQATQGHSGRNAVTRSELPLHAPSFYFRNGWLFTGIRSH